MNQETEVLNLKGNGKDCYKTRRLQKTRKPIERWKSVSENGDPKDGGHQSKKTILSIKKLIVSTFKLWRKRFSKYTSTEAQLFD